MQSISQVGKSSHPNNNSLEGYDHSSCLNSSSDASTTMKSSLLNLVNSYLLALCGLILLTWCIQWVWKRRYLYIHSWNVPGPFALPFIGAAYLFISRKRDLMEIILELQEYYPETFVLWLGTKLAYSVSTPEHIKKILSSSKALDKDNIYDFASFIIGEGLLTAKATKWKKHRKIIMPAFNQKILNAYQKIFVRKGEVFADQLQKNIGNQEMDLHELVLNCTLDIICETALGLNMNIQTSNTDFCKNLERSMEITVHRMSHIWHYLKFTWNWYSLSKEYDKVIKTFKDFTEAIIKKKLEAYSNKQNSKYSTSLTKVEESPEEVAFLDLILENKNFTELELREEVDLFVVAGSDTTASAISFTLTMLGMLPDVQQKVLEEILNIVGPDRKVLPCDLPEMKYTERVIKESLRLFPVGAFFARTISEDIDAGDVFFPAGSSVFFGSVHIHRNPKYWTDPLKFDPDRFLPENVAERHPCTYIAFSYGSRDCIGAKYAMMNIKTILATILRRFKIYTKYKTIEEIKFKASLMLRMEHGPKVWVGAR